MVESLEVGTASAEPGELAQGFIKGPELNTGNSVDVPVIVLNGAHEGNTFLMYSTNHGIEIQGIEVIRQVLRHKVDPDELRGAVVAIPTANPLAYQHHLYRSWVDNGDVGYSTTKEPYAGATEFLAHQIWTEAWSRSDLVMNIHANTRPEALIWQGITMTEGLEDELERMAEAFDVTTMYYGYNDESAAVDSVAESEMTPTLSNRGAVQAIPELLVELIDGRAISNPSTRVGVRGTLNVMKEFDMIDGAIKPQEDIRRVDCRYTGGSGVNRYHGLVDAKKGGILHPLKMPGEFIEEGERIANVMNVHGEIVQEVEMPRDGYIWAYPSGGAFATAGSQTVETGSNIAFVFYHEDE